MQHDVRSSRTPNIETSLLGLDRRQALGSLGMAAAILAGAGFGLDSTGLAQDSSPLRPDPLPMTPEALGWDPKAKQYVLPPLPYKSDALEPHIDKQTMELHHDKHHASYVSGLNKALSELSKLRGGESDLIATRNWLRELAFNGSGHFLHVLFWNGMGPKAGGTPRGTIAEQIDASFGSFKSFSDQFQTAA
ncbi:MAG: superoxide dismutase, partial [Phycisphaerales bacterium]|nr:superoxide dismutase [Phycisphaerales bacterium]MCI0674317.1 superoxide dismutase [Phycisphaerales bacterium]